MKNIDVNLVFVGYVECALWSTSGDCVEFLDERFTIEDINTDCKSLMFNNCINFINLANKLLKIYPFNSEQLGHDLWLTQNGHGAGFWDRGLGELGDKLTKIAEEMGEVWLYVGDDDKIYCR